MIKCLNFSMYRLCGCNRDYLKEPAVSRGSQKLLHWSAQDVMNWLHSIELDEYIEGFERMGIHGAFMVGGTSGLIRTTLPSLFLSLPLLHLVPHSSGLPSPPSSPLSHSC